MTFKSTVSTRASKIRSSSTYISRNSLNNAIYLPLLISHWNGKQLKLKLIEFFFQLCDIYLITWGKRSSRRSPLPNALFNNDNRKKIHCTTLVYSSGSHSIPSSSSREMPLIDLSLDQTHFYVHFDTTLLLVLVLLLCFRLVAFFFFYPSVSFSSKAFKHM